MTKIKKPAKKNLGGRPPLPPEQRKSWKAYVRLTPEVGAKIERLARRLGMTPAAFLAGLAAAEKEGRQ